MTEKSKKFEWFWTKMDDYLAKHNLKQTRQRLEIIEIFLELNTHVDAEMLHGRAKERGLGVGLATIYRTLNLLMQAGLVEQQSFADGRSVFELDIPNEHHDHLVCLDCGRVVEFRNEEIESQQSAVAKRLGFNLNAHRLDLYGNCIATACEHRKPKS